MRGNNERKHNRGEDLDNHKTEDFFAAIAVLGDELDYVKFVGLYNEDDLVELQLDPDAMLVSQVTLTSCHHFDNRAEAMPVPDAEEGIAVVDMPEHVDCTDLRVIVFDDGLAIRVVDKLPISYVRMGDVLFGVSADNDLTSILLTGMSPEEVSHARAELSGDDYDDVWTLAEN